MFDAIIEFRRARDEAAEAAAIRELLLEIDLLGRGLASREQESGADQQGERRVQQGGPKPRPEPGWSKVRLYVHLLDKGNYEA